MTKLAHTIWQAGVAAVSAERLVREAVACDGKSLKILDEEWLLSPKTRVIVVGAGKAGAGMAAGLEQALGPDIVASRVSGWVNVPADCVRSLPRIVLHPGRPAGVNEPTAEGVFGTGKILDLAQGAGPDDICVVLISGGGSALLPAPRPPVTLADKQAVTRFLMRSGATIQELNTVRKCLSLVKGGGLARAAKRAGRVVTLIISDVTGDPLDLIASGPTVPGHNSAALALEILARFGGLEPEVPAAVFQVLRTLQAEEAITPPQAEPFANVTNRLLANNATAVHAAAAEASARGFEVRILGDDQTGTADEVGRELAEACLSLREMRSAGSPPLCLISGGEPTVRLLPTTHPRKGGRNQQLVRSALCRLWHEDLKRIVILSGGTDGEDGPTDAAGAYLDATIRDRARGQGLDPQAYYSIQNAYMFFEGCGGLLKTGPTHTNVMDLRVALVGQVTDSG